MEYVDGYGLLGDRVKGKKRKQGKPQRARSAAAHTAAKDPRARRTVQRNAEDLVYLP